MNYGRLLEIPHLHVRMLSTHTPVFTCVWACLFACERVILCMFTGVYTQVQNTTNLACYFTHTLNEILQEARSIISIINVIGVARNVF